MACSLFIISSRNGCEHYHCSLFVDSICYVSILRLRSVSIFSLCYVFIVSLCYVSISRLCYVSILSLVCEVFSLCFVWCV